MTFHVSTSFTLGAGLSYCCVYMVLGQHEVHAGIKLMPASLSHAGMKCYVGGGG